MPVTSPWSAWFAVMMLLTPEEPPLSDPEPVCVRLVNHIGADKVDKLNKRRGAKDPDFLRVCSRIATEAVRQELNPAIAVSVAYAESGMRWDPAGSKSFTGPMQVGVRWCKAPLQGCVPDGVRHLLIWRSKSKSWDGALWGYVGGHARKLSRRQKKRKRSYVKRVKAMIKAISN